MKNKTGIIEVIVKLKLERDVNEEEAREIVEDLCYDFKHELISSSEIIADDIAERTEE